MSWAMYLAPGLIILAGAALSVGAVIEMLRGDT